MSTVAKNERLFRALIENSVEQIVLVDAEGRRTYASPSSIRTSGYTPEELVGGGAFEHVHPDDMRRAQAAFQDLVARPGGVSAIELRIRHKDGRYIWLDLTGTNLLADPAVSAVVVSGRNVTERKEAEQQMRSLATAIEQAGEQVVLTTLDGTIQYCNPAFERITGYAKEEAIGQNARLLKSGEHDDAFYRWMWQTISAGQVWSGQFRNKRKDGEIFTEDATISPIHDVAGTMTGFVAVKRDVTERVQLEAQLRQAQKLEGIGRLAGGIAHDFNNLLGVILGYTEMLAREVDPSEYWRTQAIEEAAKRASTLTKQLLAFGRQQVLQPKVLNLNNVASETEQMLGRLIGEHIELRVSLDHALAHVKADSGQLVQVIMNLAINARDAMPDGGTIEIATANVTFATDEPRDGIRIAAGRYVELAVKDTGPGMSPNTRAQIFEPFFTTKPVGQGTGLGLATVYGIVKQSSGYIIVDSALGQGTTFRVYLPQVDEPVEEERPVRTAPATMPEGSETILVVEDEPALAEIITESLRGSRYEILVASNGVDALEVAQKYPGVIDILITDVVMPQMSGPELGKRMTAARPGIKILYMSGYIDKAPGPFQLLQPGVALIQKPFALSTLAQKVREMVATKTEV